MDCVLLRLAGGRLYAVPVTGVREIVPYRQPSRLPAAVPHLLGVVDLRGTIVPVHDLAPILGTEQATEPTLIAVLEGKSTAGIVIERVEGIRAVDAQAPRKRRRGALVTALAVAGDEVVEVLDAAACLRKLEPARRRRR